jgi:hypothetical protein
MLADTAEFLQPFRPFTHFVTRCDEVAYGLRMPSFFSPSSVVVLFLGRFFFFRVFSFFRPFSNFSFDFVLIFWPIFFLLLLLCALFDLRPSAFFLWPSTFGIWPSTIGL